MWIHQYRQWLQIFIRAAEGSLIRLETAKIMPDTAKLCSKHSMTELQNALYQFIDRFYARPEPFYDFLNKEEKEEAQKLADDVYLRFKIRFKIPIKYEDFFVVRQDFVYVRILPITTVFEYVSLLANTEKILERCHQSYSKYFHCKWCHRSWISQSLCMVDNRKKSHYQLNINSINEFIRCQPPDLKTRDKMHIIDYGINYFSKGNAQKAYIKLVEELWQKSDQEIDKFHELLNKEQLKWLSLAARKQPPQYCTNKYQNYYKRQNHATCN